MKAFRRYDKSHIKYLVRLSEEDAPIILEPHYEIVERYDLAMDQMEDLKESLEAAADSITIATKVSVKANKPVYKKVGDGSDLNQPAKRMIISNLLKSFEPESDAAAQMIVALRSTKPQVNKKSNPPPCAKKKKTNPGGKRKTVPNMNSPANQDGDQVSYLSAWNKASSSTFEQDGSWWTQGGFGLALKRALWPEKLDKGSYRLFI